MPKCTILVGVPGSGKSTWLKQRDNENIHVVSTDDIIEDIADTYELTYNEAFKELIRFADMVMVKDMIFFAENGYELYIDRTNMSVKSRAQFINKLKKYGYTFDAVVFETPENGEWERRLNSRPGKNIPAEALERMQNMYQVPTKEEGFETITFISNK